MITCRPPSFHPERHDPRRLHDSLSTAPTSTPFPSPKISLIRFRVLSTLSLNGSQTKIRLGFPEDDLVCNQSGVVALFESWG